VVGLKNVNTALGNISKALKDRRDIQRQIGIEVVTDIRAKTRAGLDADGVPFQRLDPRTLENRLGRGIASNRPLVATGEMLSSLSFRISQRGNQSITAITLDGQRQKDKASFHHRTGRVFLALSNRMIRRIGKMYLSDVESKLESNT
jgi:hypothetical protein